MKVSLIVNMEKNADKKTVVAHYEVDGDAAKVDANTYSLLLSAATNKMVLESAQETQLRVERMTNETLSKINENSRLLIDLVRENTRLLKEGFNENAQLMNTVALPGDD